MSYSALIAETDDLRPPYLVAPVTENFNTASHSPVKLYELSEDDILRTLRGQVIVTGCVFKTIKAEDVSHDPCLARYVPFMYCPDQTGPTFVNTVHVVSDGKNAPTAENQISEMHEGIHALQWADAADLHASPFNSAMTYTTVLCPRDGIIAGLLTELDAYAKTGLLCTLAGRTDTSVRDASKNHPVSAEEFEKLCKTMDVESALCEAGWAALQKKIKGGDQKLFDHYCDQATVAYDGKGLLRLDDKYFQYVRLGKEAPKIGMTLGLNSFGNDFAALVQRIEENFSPETKAWIAQKNAELGITDEQELPMLDQALVRQNLSLGQFFQRSKKNKFWRDEPVSRTSQAELIAA